MPGLRLLRLFLLLALLCAGSAPVSAREAGSPGALGVTTLAALPPEVRATLVLVERGGPLPFRRDSVEFHNREQRLPGQARGYYREYTVPTPGARDRGARRLIAGQGHEYYYSDDHYRSFRRILP